MNSAQQAALEAVAGRALTASEIVKIDAVLTVRNDTEIAAILSAGQPTRMVSLRVEDVFDTLFASGDYMTLKVAQLQGSASAIMAFAVLDDARRIGSGMVDLTAAPTQQLLANLKGLELLSDTGYNALIALATVPCISIDYNTVSDALNIAEGRLTL